MKRVLRWTIRQRKARALEPSFASVLPGSHKQRNYSNSCVPNNDSPVLIVGGGPVGMFTALLLSRLKVPSIVVEKYARGGDGAEGSCPNSEITPPHPRAHVLHTRSMELLRQIGLEKEVWEKVPPCDHWKRFRYCSSLLGSTLAQIDHFNTNEFKMLREASPCRVSQFSQPLLESVLRDALIRECNESKFCQVLYEHEFEELRSKSDKEKSSSLTAIVSKSKNHESGSNSETKLVEIECSHVVAADGAYSKVRRHLGIGMGGERDLETFASIHFSSKSLGKELIDTENGAMLTFVFNDETIAVVVAHDMRKGDWVIHVPFFPPIQSAKDFEDKKYVENIIKACIGCSNDDISFELHSVRAWGMHATRADKFVTDDNKVFFVGDAAHQFPPSGGFGVNAGLADAHNLACKLALVKHGQAENSYLATYDLERRPVIEEAIQVAVDNYRRGLIPAKVLGLDRGTLATVVSMINVAASGLGNLPISRASTDLASKNAVDAVLRAGRLHLNGPVSKSSPYKHLFYDLAKARKSLVHVVEEKKEGLPLLFPHTDIGFRYNLTGAEVAHDEGTGTGNENKSSAERSGNILSWTDPPINQRTAFENDVKRIRYTLQPGCILPHVYFRDLNSGKNVSSLDLCELDTKLTVITNSKDLLDKLLSCCNKDSTNKLLKMRLIFVVDNAHENTELYTFDKNVKVVVDTSKDWSDLCNSSRVSGVLVRPDQHILHTFNSHSNVAQEILELK